MRELLPFNAQMSHREIAEELGMTVGAVHMTLHRALRKLRSHGLTLTCKELADDLDSRRKGSVHYEA